MFGTFQKEEATPTYGLTKPLESHSFLWQHFHFTLELLMAIKKAGSWTRKFRILFGKPDNIDPRFRGYLERKWLSRQREESGTTPLFNFILFQTLFTLIILFLTILFEYYLTGIQLALLTIFILLSVINTGAMLEQRKWIFHLAYAKTTIFGLLAYSFWPLSSVALTVIIVLFCITAWYRFFSNLYRAYVYQVV